MQSTESVARASAEGEAGKRILKLENGLNIQVPPFIEAGDVFDETLSSKLRKHVYEKGSTEEAMDLYVKFRGRKPIIEPLLKVRGLDGKPD